MTSTTQHAYPSTAARARYPFVPTAIHPGSAQAGNPYRVFGADPMRVAVDVAGHGVRRSSGVSGLLPVDPAITHDVRHGYSPARTNRGIGPKTLNPTLNPHLNGLAASTANKLYATGAYTALSTAATYDPEPISSSILAIGSSLVGLFSKVFAGCGNTCIAATKVVDQVEAQYLKPLLAQWNSLPVKYESNRAAALAVFDQAWQLVVQGCSDPALGEAGQRCISERQRGGTSKWCPSCNWFTLYRDPIANDTSVLPDPVSQSQTFSGGLLSDPSVSGGQASATTSPLTNTAGSLDLASNVNGIPVWAWALGIIAILAGTTGGR